MRAERRGKAPCRQTLWGQMKKQQARRQEIQEELGLQGGLEVGFVTGPRFRGVGIQ